MESFGGNSDEVSARELAGLNPNEPLHEVDQQEEAGGAEAKGHFFSALQRTHVATHRHHHVETPRANGGQWIIGFIVSSKIKDLRIGGPASSGKISEILQYPPRLTDDMYRLSNPQLGLRTRNEGGLASKRKAML